ncbi:carboxypeptidase-like regulatory domain-containing protein [Patescibacteria group bacterium]|nr:carboxypeptidase-like regulatory domain-containing protein [Patescibacteria group bacterium]
MVLNKKQPQSGFSLVEILIVSAVMLVVFGGLLISFRYSLELISHSRAKLTALTLANDNMEYIRSLSYNAVGTVSGIPSGLIPQVSTTTLNGIMFTKRVLIDYVDDDADGLGVADSNGITTDYKQAKVTLSWTLRGVTKEVFLVSNIIPRSIETDVGGGTVRVNVFNDDTVPLPGADVRLINTTLVPNIDVTRSSDASGIALFGGAPAGSDYEVIVTAPGYSTDRTIKATTTLPNPTRLPIAVVEASVSTLNMFIDELSDVSIAALANKVPAVITEPFTGTGGIATSTDTAVTGGRLQLQGAPGSYSGSGVAYLSASIPSPLAGWDYLLVEGTETSNTNVLVRFYTGSSTAYALIPDSELPGNAVGFSIGAFDITQLDAVLYPEVTIGLTLTTTNANETPQVDAVVLGYTESQSPFASESLIFTGAKSIGTRADASIVYKTVISTTTNASGQVTLRNIEADTYTVSSAGYDVAAVCVPTGLTVVPGTNTDLELLFAPDTANSLRVAVTTAGGSPVIGAVVELERGAFSETQVTGSCGQVFFNSLTPAIDYTLDVQAAGYTSQNLVNIDISGDELQNVTF